jgi:hypothetical protein
MSDSDILTNALVAGITAAVESVKGDVSTLVVDALHRAADALAERIAAKPSDEPPAAA